MAMMTTVEESKLIDIIKEHCTYCPGDLYAVAQALLSVEDKLDYALKFDLELVLKAYVIARARLHPDGLKSVLAAFPLEGGDTSQEGMATALVQEAINLYVKLSGCHEASGTLRGASNTLLVNSLKLALEQEGVDVIALRQHIQESVKGPDDVIGLLFPGSGEPAPHIRENAPLPVDIEGLEEFRLASRVTRLASTDGSVWNVRLIQSGHTVSGRYFPDDVLREAMSLFEGARSYMNHPPEDYQGGDRPLQTWVGWYENVQLKEGDGLYADWHILANSGVSWLRSQLVELANAGKLGLIGLSLLGLGKSSFKKVDGKTVKFSEGIHFVRSVDLVDVPGAGGKIVETIKLSDDAKVRRDIMELEALTLDQIKEGNPRLYEEILKMSGNGAASDPEPEGSTAIVQVKEVLAQLQLQERSGVLNDRLRESNLPQPMKDAVREQFQGMVFTDDALDTQIKVYREAAAALAPQSGPYHLPSQAHLITAEERMQVAVDRLFGLEIPEDMQDTPRLSGIREAYLMMTGDYDFSWGAIPLGDSPAAIQQRERIREALPTAATVVGGGTITFANVLGTSMNRRLVAQYRAQRMWWEPVTTITDIANLKQQDRNRVESLGSLTERTTGGAEYAELTWAETVHTWTPTEYGDILPIAQRAIVNDDLRAPVRASSEMGRSAGITLNEYVSNLFTQNSGAGPVFADVGQDGAADAGTENVFEAGTATHNNLLTVNLNRANFGTADKTLRNMLDKSQKKIGLTPGYLLIPVDLREVALQIQLSEQVPDSANRARNIFANTFGVIEVPQWTDVNNWYLMSTPDQIEMLEMGFLNGRRDPEVFVQSSPEAGMMFTHDVLSYKIRHRYGGGWVDYRGSIASLVT